MADLDDFGVDATVDRPRVERKKVLQSPHTGKIAGFICRELNRQQKVYTTRRWRSHFYRNGNGYAISDSILDECERHHVSRILIHDGDRDEAFAVWEFPLRQCTVDGTAIPDSVLKQADQEDDPQTYVDVEDCLHEWQFDRDEHLFRSSFEKAMDRISWRGYDADLKDRIQAGQA